MPTKIIFKENMAGDIIRELVFELEAGLAEIVVEAKRNAPVDTGNLKSRIRSGVKITRNKIQGKLWTTGGYGAAVEEGSGLWGPKHDYIYPKKAKVLAWRGKEDDQSNIDGWIFAKRVTGSPPRPYLKPAIDRGIPRMLKRFKTIVGRV